MMINFWAVILAAIANMLIGYFWFSDKFFGKRLKKYSGYFEPENTRYSKENRWKSYAIDYLFAYVMAYMLAFFILATDAITVLEGLGTAFWLWLGFIVTTHLPMAPGGNKPTGYFWNIILYYLAVLFVESLIIVLLR